MPSLQVRLQVSQFSHASLESVTLFSCFTTCISYSTVSHPSSPGDFILHKPDSRYKTNRPNLLHSYSNSFTSFQNPTSIVDGSRLTPAAPWTASSVLRQRNTDEWESDAACHVTTISGVMLTSRPRLMTCVPVGGAVWSPCPTLAYMRYNRVLKISELT